MSIGQFRKKLYFERSKRADDGGGGAAITWIPAWSCWGSIQPERGREVLAAGRLESSNGAVIRIRSSAAAREIDASYRVKDGDDIYVVRSIINPDQRGRFLDLVCEKGVASHG